MSVAPLFFSNTAKFTLFGTRMNTDFTDKTKKSVFFRVNPCPCLKSTGSFFLSQG